MKTSLNNFWNSSAPPKILVVDDHALIRRGIMALLKNHNKKWEVHEAGDGYEAIMKTEQLDPDIILMDYHMPKISGSKTTSLIKKAFPNARIIVVSMDTSSEVIIDSIYSGAQGIVSKQSADDELIQAIDDVYRGKRYLGRFAPDLEAYEKTGKIGSPAKQEDSLTSVFTEREIDVLKLIIKGFPSAIISKELSISYRTVENHKAKIFQKCNVHSTSELINYAIKAKLVTISTLF